MPRSARYNVPGTICDVISRFVDRGWFFSANEERQRIYACSGTRS